MNWIRFFAAVSVLSVPAFLAAQGAPIANTRSDISSVSSIKIDTVEKEYTPKSGAGRRQLSMRSFNFEIEENTRRARVRVYYTYFDQPTYAGDEIGRGPRPTIAQIPGLRYDTQAHAVVYESDGKKTVCASVVEHKGMLGRRLSIENTGSCVVTAEDVELSEDDGWQVRHYRAMDVYFVVR